MSAEHTAFIVISGAEALPFLQGQLTCDLNAVTQQPSFGAYCNHQGRVLASFSIVKHDEGYRLQLPAHMLQDTFDTLHKYAVFSKVTLSSDAASLFGVGFCWFGIHKVQQCRVSRRCIFILT